MDAIKASVLEKLIRELCPEGVEYRELSELFKTKNGYTPSKGNKEFWENGNIPWFRMDDIRQNGGILSHALQNVTEKAVKGELFPENSLIVATTATIGEHALITVPSLANQQFTCLSLKEEYKNQFVIKFLYYYCFKLDEYCKKNLNQGSLASVDRGKFSKFKFPLPPLPIQQEIVRILDTFTNLTAELTAELTARRKQYEYYRDELLTFGEDVSRVQLGLVCDFKYGKGNNIPNETGEYPVYGCNGIVSTTNTFNSEDAPIIGHIGSAGVVNWGKGKHFVTYNGTICRVKADKIRSRYAYYVLNSLHLERFVKGSQPFLSYGDFSKVLIPLPPIERQDEIVRILDQFDYFCNDLTSGIPAEISARQKQYEYYRDQLLTFKRIGG